ncbi:MAG: tyrosine-type recombinase/integrase, partial [Myxococcota bacterium]
MKGIDGQIDAFMNHAAIEQGLARDTLDAYARDLARYARFLVSRRTVPAQVTPDLVSVYLATLVRDGLSPRSAERNLVTVRRLHTYLQASGAARTNPTADIPPPRRGRNLPKVLSLDEVEAILAAPDRSKPRGLRDAAMLETLYATGFRVTELITLRMRDLKLDAAFARTMGKGGKEKAVPLSDAAVARLSEYL